MELGRNGDGMADAEAGVEGRWFVDGFDVDVRLTSATNTGNAGKVSMISRGLEAPRTKSSFFGNDSLSSCQLLLLPGERF